MIPRADVLANVAAKQPIADAAPQVERNRFPQLDRQIADAARGVENIRLGKGLRRTGVEAGAASSAVVGSKRLVVSERLIGEQGREKEVAPGGLLISSVCLPIQPSPASWANSRSRKGAVSTTPRAFASALRFCRTAIEPLELAVNQIVIIPFAPRIARDAPFARPGAVAAPPCGTAGPASRCFARRRERAVDAVSLLPRGKIIHLAGIAAIEPFGQMRDAGGRHRGANADRAKPSRFASALS